MIREAFSRRLTPDRAHPPHDWARVERILDSILDSPPAERSRILDDECAGDPSLRMEVARILSESEKENGFLELSAAEFAGDLASSKHSRNNRTLIVAGALAAIAVAGTAFILIAGTEPSPLHGTRTSGNVSIRALDSIKSLSDSLHAAGVRLREERKYADAEIALRRAATNRMMMRPETMAQSAHGTGHCSPAGPGKNSQKSLEA